MTNLSIDRLEAAKSFLRTQARPLEQALFAHSFEGGSQADVFAALAAYQNSDGGFGHGLEADVRLPGSSVICTSIAFQVLRHIAAPSDHPLVAGGCAYVAATFDEATSNWPDVPPTLDDAPHAPWWRYREDLATRRCNPRAELAGYLVDYSEHFPAAMREAVVESVATSIANHQGEMEMHDLLCVLRFWESPGLPPAIRTALAAKVRALVRATIARDPAASKAYGLPPLDVVDSPESPFATDFAEEIPIQLDHIIASQSASGAWEPTWSWGDGSDAWQQAHRDWSGVLTLANLRKLRAFGRLP